MYFKLTNPLHLSAIPRYLGPIAQIRKEYKIAIIDNEPYPYTNEMHSHGFDIHEVGDIHDFAAVAEYPIVACDVKDVGKHFQTAYEGAHVMAEIRARYPDKYIVAYSAGTFGAEYKKYWDHCDVFLRRDVGFDQWVETFDQAVKLVGDPVQRWKRIRSVLLASDVPAFEIFLLEEAYIRSILKKDVYILSKALEHAKHQQSIGELLDNIAGGLITSVKLFIHIVS